MIKINKNLRNQVIFFLKLAILILKSNFKEQLNSLSKKEDSKNISRQNSMGSNLSNKNKKNSEKGKGF